MPLTNLHKPFWPTPRITKGDLLQYYADVAPVLLPHLRDRAMVMKRYPNGAAGEFFFMKRAPSPRPEWIETCAIEHESGNVIDFPMIQDLRVAALGGQPRLHRPEPVVRALRRRRPARLPALRSRSRCPAPTFAQVRETALVVREALDGTGDAELSRRPPARAGCTSTCRSCAARRRRRSGRSPRRSRRRWRRDIRS